jgi:hypothetical protein
LSSFHSVPLKTVPSINFGVLEKFLIFDPSLECLNAPPLPESPMATMML